MASGKDPSPLFDIVRNARRARRRPMQLPDWMKPHDQRHAAEQDNPAASDPAADPASHTSRSVSPHSRTSASDDESTSTFSYLRDYGASALGRWWKHPIAFRLTQGMLVMLGVGAFVFVIIVYLIGHRIGQSQSLASARNYEQNAAITRQLREQPVTPLISPNVEGVDDAIPPPNVNGATGGDDPREPGLNFYRLTSLPATSDKVAAILRFLSENGVDAAAVPINNGRSVKIMALRGFDNPRSDPKAQAYAERLKMLGRKWKAENSGWSDWKDLYPEKYRPGRN